MILLVDTFMNSIAQYILHTETLEWLGVFTGLLCVWLAAKNNIWGWPFAIVSVIIYMFIFFENKLYADMGLQVYFLAMNIYGWYYWRKEKDNPSIQQPITLISKKACVLSAIGVVFFTLILGFLLHKNTDASFPFIDSFCTACSLIAQALLARRVLHNWIIWIFVDIIYVAVYLSKDLYATSLMYAIYVVIAIMGYIDWKKIYHEQTN